jgi:hypothetical protein
MTNKLKWLVRLTGSETGLKVIVDGRFFDGSDLKIFKRNFRELSCDKKPSEGYFLFSKSFEDAASPSDVDKKARIVFAMVRASLNVLHNSTFDVSVNSILEFQADGSFQVEHAFLTGSAKVKTTAIGNLTDSNAYSDAQQIKHALIYEWVLRALEDEKLETAFLDHAGYKQGLEPYFDLYKVYETIRNSVVNKSKLTIELGRDPKSKDLDNELLKLLFPKLKEVLLKTQEEELKAFNETTNNYRHANKKLPQKNFL